MDGRAEQFAVYPFSNKSIRLRTALGTGTRLFVLVFVLLSAHRSNAKGPSCAPAPFNSSFKPLNAAAAWRNWAKLGQTRRQGQVKCQSKR